jgi:hypothetical protein
MSYSANITHIHPRSEICIVICKKKVVSMTNYLSKIIKHRLSKRNSD